MLMMESILKHVERTGGATLTRQLNLDEHPDGYYVAFRTTNILLDFSDRAWDDKRADAMRAIEDTFNLYKYAPLVLVGLWHNPWDKSLYVEASLHMETLNDAMNLAQAFGQDYIYDIRKQDSIQVR